MNKTVKRYWAIGSAVWVLAMGIMSFQDFKYGLKYHVFHGRVQAEHEAKMTEYEKALRDGEAEVKGLLSAARRYEKLTFLSLAGRRGARVLNHEEYAGNDELPETARPTYRTPKEEMAALEAIHGRAALRKYREQNAETEQRLMEDMRARLIVPKMKEPRLASVLFNMLALPLVILLVLFGYEEWNRRFVKVRL